MATRIEHLRVLAFPPLSLAVGLGENAVIGNALKDTTGIGILGAVIPTPCSRGMNAHAEAEACLPRSTLPPSHNVLVRAFHRGVPWMVLAVPEVEVVVMIGQCYEILRTGTLIETDKPLRIPVLGFPLMGQVFESHFRRMVEMLEMIFVLARTLFIHIMRIPVSILGNTLRSPVRPDAELGIAEPLWRFKFLERTPGGLVFAKLHGLHLTVNDVVIARIHFDDNSTERRQLHADAPFLANLRLDPHRSIERAVGHDGMTANELSFLGKILLLCRHVLH